MTDKSQIACGIFHDMHWPGNDVSGCYLPDDHDGPHEYKDEKGKAWCWETDLTCDCSHCRRCEGDYCTEYWPKEQRAMTTLHLPLKREYFEAIRDGTKPEEFRLGPSAWKAASMTRSA